MTELARKVLDLSNFELYLTNFVLGKGWVKNKILPEKYLRQNPGSYRRSERGSQIRLDCIMSALLGNYTDNVTTPLVA